MASDLGESLLRCSRHDLGNEVKGGEREASLASCAHLVLNFQLLSPPSVKLQDSPGPTSNALQLLHLNAPLSRVFSLFEEWPRQQQLLRLLRRLRKQPYWTTRSALLL